MKKQYIYLLSIIFIANLLIACGNELVEINENPNATENPDPAYLLSAAQYHAADLYWVVRQVIIQHYFGFNSGLKSSIQSLIVTM